LRLSGITGFSLEDIERNVLALRKQTGHACALRLPIKYSPPLAGLVGYSLGDGHVGQNPTAFVYTSKNLSTINRVKDLVRETFGINVSYQRCKGYRCDVYFPYIVGELLLKFGSVSGSKTEKSFSVPSWITQGSREIKRAFLRALFEDEGSVSIHRDAKGIVLGLWKRRDLSWSLRLFLNQLRGLLVGFDIDSRKSSAGMYRDKKGKEKVGIQITIRGKRNVVKFKEEIGFQSAAKRERLEELIRSYKRDCWGRGGYDKRVYHLLMEETLTSEEIADRLNAKKITVQPVLKRLKNKNMARKVGKNGRYLLWKAT